MFVVVTVEIACLVPGYCVCIFLALFGLFNLIGNMPAMAASPCQLVPLDCAMHT